MTEYQWSCLFSVRTCLITRTPACRSEILAHPCSGSRKRQRVTGDWAAIRPAIAGWNSPSFLAFDCSPRDEGPRLTLIVSGMVAGHPGHGGAAWAVLQYVLGLKELGHDVYLIEPL